MPFSIASFASAGAFAGSARSAGSSASARSCRAVSAAPSPSPHGALAALNDQKRSFIEAVQQRVRGASHKLSKEAWRVASAARVAPPAPGSFRQLQHAYEALALERADHAVDEAAALRVRRMATAYLMRTGDVPPRSAASASASPSPSPSPAAASSAAAPRELLAIKRDLAARYVEAIDLQLLRVRERRQRDIDAACPDRHSAHLSLRSASRQRHARECLRLAPEHNEAPGALSPRLVRDALGEALYRFEPLPTRQASGPDDQGAHHAVLASVLHHKLRENGRVDLRLPVATLATIDGAPGVLIDVVAGDPVEIDATTSGSEARLALLTQWLVGRLEGDWWAFRTDPRGRIRMIPTALPTCSSASDPRSRAEQAQEGVSALFANDAGAAPGTVAQLHGPLDEPLRQALLKVDVPELTRSLSIAESAINLEIGRQASAAGWRGGIAGGPLLPPHAAERLVAPLTALQRVLARAPALPMAMLLADAADELETWAPPPAPVPTTAPVTSVSTSSARPPVCASPPTPATPAMPVTSGKDGKDRKVGPVGPFGKPAESGTPVDDWRSRALRSAPDTTLAQRLLFRQPLHQHRLRREAAQRGLPPPRGGHRHAGLRLIDRASAGIARLLRVKNPVTAHAEAHIRAFHTGR